MQNKVQLITYVERLGGPDLRALRALLTGPLAGLFGGVHLLPFFHRIDGADAGFDPIDHTRVDARLGDWADVRQLSAAIPVMADVIVNHISRQSPQFLDYSRFGARSRYAGLFLTRERVFPNGATAAELACIYRPRPGLPFTEVALECGEQAVLWSTFTSQQIDIDVFHAEGARYLNGILQQLAANGVSMIRLDAAGYAVKKAGSRCFMLPETMDFIGDFARRARQIGIEVLVEVHAHFQRQIEIARQVDWVYDFALPPLLLHAFEFGTSQHLASWIRLRPVNCLTVLDTHDGIGIIDIGAETAAGAELPGLVPPAQLDQLVEKIHRNSGGGSRLATGAAASNLDLYQVNCTYYDALGRDDQRYLVARAIQFFLPGIPQVYYMGLLAEPNDMVLLQRTGVGRDINRHYFTAQEVSAALRRPVVTRLLALIQLRNSLAAFQGEFSASAKTQSGLHLQWRKGVSYAHLQVDFRCFAATLRFSDGLEPERQFDWRGVA
jgi:sucrose phosphorylase